MSEIGCARPTGGPVENSFSPANDPDSSPSPKQEVRPMIQVGKVAPDFNAPGYHNGEFINTKLSDHLGKWVLLCFYPGDFTFV